MLTIKPDLHAEPRPSYVATYLSVADYEWLRSVAKHNGISVSNALRGLIRIGQLTTDEDYLNETL